MEKKSLLGRYILIGLIIFLFVLLLQYQSTPSTDLPVVGTISSTLSTDKEIIINYDGNKASDLLAIASRVIIQIFNGIIMFFINILKQIIK